MNIPSQSGGFSLVEVLCAILILGIAMAGLTHGLTTALSSSKESEQQTKAALLAAGRIELMRADGYLVDGTEEGNGTEGLAAYHWEQTVSSTQVAGLHEVKVVVAQGKSGQTIYELQTLLFDPPASTLNDETPGRKSSNPGRRKEKGMR